MLEQWAEIERGAEKCLQEHKDGIARLVGEPGDEESELWRSLNPKFSRDDLKGLIFLAQKKIDLYKNKLLNLETDFDAKRVQALQEQEEALLRATEEKIAALEEEQTRQLDEKREEIRAHVQAQYEADLELQLKRQASAHSMHLHDELEQQQQKITEQFEAKIKNEIDDIVAQYKVQLETERSELEAQIDQHEKMTMAASSRLRGQLDGLSTTIEERTKTESEVRALQTLIIGVNNLEAAIVNEEPIPLENALNNLRDIGVDSGFLVPVLDSIPSDARVNGVLSDKALRRTFGALKPAALENHMVGEGIHGLFQTLRSQVNHMIGGSGELDNLLTSAEGCISSNDFETAVRLLNQTSGEPRRIFAAWIEQARLWLEVKQALDVVIAMSEARMLSARRLS